VHLHSAKTAGKSASEAHGIIKTANDYFMGKLKWTSEAITDIPADRH